MKTKTIITAALVLFVFVSLSGCQYLKKRVEKIEKIEYKMTAAGKTRIEIDNLNGDVDVVTTDDTLNMLYVIAEKHDRVRINDRDKPIEGIEINIDSSGSVINVNTEYKHFGTFLGDKSNGRVNYTIKVPAKFEVYVNLTNGKIDASRLQSDSKFENVNGSIYINNCTGNMNVETVNGSIKANLDSTKGFAAETVNGSINLGSLKNVDATIEASCTNGKVKTENLNFLNLSSEKHNLTGKLGSGKNIIKLTTVNGSILMNGNYVSYEKKDHKDFDFKFEFDDNDEPVKIEVKHTDEQKGIESTGKDSVKAKDTSKSK